MSQILIDLSSPIINTIEGVLAVVINTGQNSNEINFKKERKAEIQKNGDIAGEKVDNH